MKNMGRQNLEFKIIFWVGVALIVVLGITTTVNIKTQNTIIVEQEKNLASTLSDCVLNAIRYPMVGGEQEIVQKIFDYLAQEQEIEQIFLANNEGVIKRCTNKTMIGEKMDFEMRLAQIQASSKKRVQQIQIKMAGGNRKVFSTFIPVNNEAACYACHGKEKEVLGILAVDLDWDKVQQYVFGSKIRSIAISLLSVLMIGILVLLLLRKLVIRPLNKLVLATEPAAQGDLTNKVEIESEDEIGKLGRAFNEIIKNLHSMVSHIRDMASKVSSFAQEISTSSKEMNASTQEISSTIQKIAKGVTTQAKRVEDTSRLMESMADSVKSVAGNAQTATKASEQSLEQAQSGGAFTGEAVEKMNKISLTVASAATVVQSLGDKSQQIGQITETITSIADQTNLLALNAAIEAARAGEAGRGFAVVAEEVRKLAEGSAEAARRIGSLIKGIQVETPKAVASIEAGTKEVAEGSLIVSRVSDALSEIINSAQSSAS
ncbi:MAG: HAMP domain-containing methyl-accepting chemotaxis protein, partial [Candidatus Omnitrophica bacterium]|nr:HAMP domain-containing methyl-accepting chemotaxis protein [Candidatus Omnitrophota bacterium]